MSRGGVVVTLDAPAHAFTVPVSDEQLWEMTAAFLGEGLRGGEHVVYSENDTADAVLERLEDDGVAVADSLASGQLMIVPTETVVALAAAPPDMVLEATASIIDGALDRGFPAVRIAGEASAAMRHGDGAAMLEYEARFEDVLFGRPARIMCLYDHRRYTERDITRLRAVHRHEVIAGPAFDDGLLRVTFPREAVARLAGEVDHSNSPQLRLAVDRTLDEALRAGRHELVLDLSSLRFVDIGGAASLVRAAHALPDRHRLVLAGVRPAVRRVLEHCDASSAEALRIEPRRGITTTRR